MVSVNREGYKFYQDICIPCYQTDKHALLRPAAFMDLAQEIACQAAQQLGFGYDALHAQHTAWVLSRLHIRFNGPVRWWDTVRLYTWHKGLKGLFFLRDFSLLDQTGECRICATSSWVMIDELTRHLARPNELSPLLAPSCEVEDALEEPAPKLSMPPAMEPAGEHRVACSDLDFVGHANNARYMLWAMDCLPPEEMDRPVKEVFINFHKETKLGESVQLFRLQERDTWYVEGRLDGKACFSVKMVF